MKKLAILSAIIAAAVVIGLILLWPKPSDSFTATASNDNGPCGQWKALVVSTASVVQLCKTAYLSDYDAVAEIPNNVIYDLDQNKTTGCTKRSNAFAADPAVTNGAKPGDYAKTGYDKGHMAPDDDMRWSDKTERESFLMTNMTPQLPNLNRIIWRQLEIYAREEAYAGPVTIITGAVYDPASKRINGVTVPYALYKIIYFKESGQTESFMMPQTATGNIGNYITDIKTIETKARVDITIVPSSEKKTLDDLSMPPKVCNVQHAA